jgi:REP element-mobilizing transposase RayT
MFFDDGDTREMNIFGSAGSNSYMPRAPRIDVPGLIYHVTTRGTNQQPIFLSDRDRRDFLNLLSVTCSKFPFTLHAYCLMNNHFHLLIQTIQHSLSRTIQYVTSLYGQLFNNRYDRSGRVHQGRFHSIPVQENSYFLAAARYIHLNPVKAGLVTKPEDYPWSNYGGLLRRELDPLADSSFLLGYFGNDFEESRIRYQQFVESGINTPGTVTDRVLYRMRSWGNLNVILRRTSFAQIP